MTLVVDVSCGFWWKQMMIGRGRGVKSVCFAREWVCICFVEDCIVICEIIGN